MSDNSYTITINLNGSNVVNSFNDMTKNMQSGVNGVKRSVGDMVSNWRHQLAEASLVYSGIMNVYNDVRRIIAGTISEASRAEEGLIKVATAIKSTGGAAGYSTLQLKELADELERTAAVDADEIMNNITTPLLTFLKVGGEEFKRAQKAILDVNVVLGDPSNPASLKNIAIQVGKALNDPVQGLTALRRSGVSFSDAQIKVIKNLQETNRLAAAQKIILAELDTEFKGQAEAYASTYAGGINKLNIAFGNLRETVGEKLLPAFNTFTVGLAVLMDRTNQRIKQSGEQTVDRLREQTIEWARFNSALLLNTSTVVTGIINLFVYMTSVATGSVHMISQSMSSMIESILPVINNLPKAVIEAIALGDTAGLETLWEKLKAKVDPTIEFAEQFMDVTRQTYDQLIGTFDNYEGDFNAMVDASLRAYDAKLKLLRDGFNKNKSASDDDSAASGTVDQVSEFQRMNAEMHAESLTATQKLLEEYDRRLSIIKAATKEGSEAEKAAIAELDAWKKREQEKLDKELENRRLEAQKQYYEALKFQDKSYYLHKLFQIKEELDAQLNSGMLSQAQHDTLFAKRKADLDAEKTAWDDKLREPINNLIGEYERLMATMADSRQLGVQQWKETATSLQEFKVKLQEFAADPVVAELLKKLEKQLEIAKLNAGKKDNGWFWGQLLGLDSEADRTIINSAQASYQTLSNGITDITNRMIEVNRQKRQEELAKIDEIAAKEKWSAENIANAKSQINKKYDAEERKLKRVQQNMAVVQSVINTAEAITKALTMGPVLGPIFAGIIGAMGTAQIALIKAQKFASGGLFKGRGGPRDDANLVWISDEEYVVNAESTKQWLPILEMINRGGQGYRFQGNGMSRSGYAAGGVVSGGTGIGKLVKDSVREVIGQIKVVIDATSPDAKQWAKHIYLGNQQLAADTI